MADLNIWRISERLNYYCINNNNNGRFTTVVVVELLLNASEWQKQVKIYNLRNRFFAKNHLFHKQIRDFFISLTSLWIN